MNENANRPINEVRYGGIKVVIWRNQTANGPMYNVTVARLYKNGDDWRESHSFGQDDLLVLAKALDNAFEIIHAHKTTAAAS